jgi:hypothetical protein
MDRDLPRGRVRRLLFALLIVHGLIHFAGFARSFGLSRIPDLSGTIPAGLGVVWLAAGLAMLATALLLVVAPRVWWAAGLGAVVLSQVAIATSWNDARFGTLANVLVLAGVVYGLASEGPPSFGAAYRRQVGRRLTGTGRGGTERLVTEADLAPFPEPVRRYLRVTGSVGRPRVHHFGARWRGRIRAAAGDPWMPFTAEQHDFVDEPARFFHMDARRGLLPVDVYHAFAEGSASMRVRLLSLVPLVDARGAQMDRAETVTLFNDLCVLAPAALLDPAIRWEPVGKRAVRGHYTLGPNTISAVLSFGESGELVDFVSDDRIAAAPDGKSFARQRWSTPVRDYRSFGGRRVATRGEGRWHPPEGEFAYLELELLDLMVNGGD